MNIAKAFNLKFIKSHLWINQFRCTRISLINSKHLRIQNAKRINVGASRCNWDSVLNKADWSWFFVLLAQISPFLLRLNYSKTESSLSYCQKYLLTLILPELIPGSEEC